jgi:hypothetical protein
VHCQVAILFTPTTIPVRFQIVCILHSTIWEVPFEHSGYGSMKTLFSNDFWIQPFYVPISPLWTLVPTAVQIYFTFWSSSWYLRICLWSKSFGVINTASQELGSALWEEFNSSRHLSYKFQFDQYYHVHHGYHVRWSSFQYFKKIRVLGCVYIQVYTWLWVHRLCQ